MKNVKQQQQFWDDWNARTREKERPEVSRRQAEVIIGWLKEKQRQNIEILEVGCGSGWFCHELSVFGKVTGTDLSETVLKRAQNRWPDIKFFAGDFFALPFAKNSFDFVVSLEVLSHVEDQQKFLEKIADLLRPGGWLFLATQNRTTLEKYCNIPPPGKGQIRKWVNATELRNLLDERFTTHEIRSVTPIAHKGFLRLLTSKKFNAVIRPLVGEYVTNVLEEKGYGWTLMARSQK